MNVLVSSFSRGIHVKNIAKGTREEVSQRNETKLKTLEDVGTGDFAGYDVIFAACKKKKTENKGCVDGRETLITPFYEAVKRELDLSDEEWEDMVKLMNRNPMVQQMIGRGHEEDVSKAKAFARETLV